MFKCCRRIREILGRSDVDLGGGDETFQHRMLTSKPPLDDGFHFAGDHAAFIANGQDGVPKFCLNSALFLWRDHHALFVFELLNQGSRFWVADLGRLLMSSNSPPEMTPSLLYPYRRDFLWAALR